MGTYKLLVHSARQVVLVASKGERFLKGEDMKHIAVLEKDGANGVSIIVGRDGLIHAVGYDADIQKKYCDAEFDRSLDASGMCIVPGLVDGHTHPVWAGDRVHEFAMKLAGATYMEVHAAGGGINFTVDHTRKASEDQLLKDFEERLRRMLRCGTTLVECKSGYGLDVETEVKMLKVMEKAKKIVPIDISSTFCGAHSVPKGKTADEAADDVINVQLSSIKALMDSGELGVDSIDVFCEKGVYDVEQTRRILQAGKDMGLLINFHGEELNYLGSAQMGAELSATAISHLEEVSDEGIAAMATSNTVAVVLPTTAYILRLRAPPVRKMIDGGVPVALGTDFNPNAFCLSMPLVMHLACVNFRMTMNEALCAATLNAAASVGKSNSHGSIEVGKVGDMLVINAPRWEHLIYQLGGQDHVIKHVIRRGDVVHSN
ncbi:probable imidazolonepropionase [Lingula anatina]|uniref:Probable imidazolonepropionase n=1 Tax=Lingula anatina TaxID=7574 RepID=A0A1S3KBT8_LINAN|nr:probable imidazolonepropionase [Lingula anatina]|eukprot:XP_013419726.1 probable imidazolonepropionase [Lingula anatina]